MRVAVCLLLSFLPAWAQQSAAKRVVPVTPAETLAFDQSRKIALLVGVGRYPPYSGIGSLQYPGRDVAALAAQLERQGYTVIQMADADATRSSVRGALRNIKEVLDQKDGTLLFFFSGHGWAPAGRNFLAAYDADGSSLADSGLALEEVLRLMAETGARRRVAWIDACRNEPGKSLPSSRSFATLNQAEGTRVLFSTRAGKMSFENNELRQGVFTHFLIRALQGEAARADGLVTFRDVADFVTEGVQGWGLQRGDLQIPYEAGEASGDFLLARTKAPEVIAPTEPAPVAREAVPPVAEVRKNPKDGLTYVWVPPGIFPMGCSVGDSECFENEKPAREVTITKGFWMGQTEVTVGAFQRFVAASRLPMPGQPIFKSSRELNPGWKSASMPIVNVDWDDANSYCEWIGGRLPTEAEWERAARGGRAASRYGVARDVAWFADNSGAKILDSMAITKAFGDRLFANSNSFHPVGLKLPNPYSLHDMLGNVWEWTRDWYDEKYYQNGDRRDPQGPPHGGQRVLRGGSWALDTQHTRVSLRDGAGLAFRSIDIGFRCALE
jgi:formylglycine-generating enzyme required for sulfatase activity